MVPIDVDQIRCEIELVMKEKKILWGESFFVWRSPVSFDSCRILRYEETGKETLGRYPKPTV